MTDPSAIRKLIEGVTEGPELRLDAYYYGFEATGQREIDEILSAVACAGKAYHHTDNWNEPTYETATKDDTGPSYVEQIQQAAKRAAEKLAAARTLLPQLLDEVERLTRALVMYDDKARDVQAHWGDPGGYTHNALQTAQLVHGDTVSQARARIAELEAGMGERK